MDRLNMYYDNTTDLLVHRPETCAENVIWRLIPVETHNALPLH